jgi:hypothetical protein
VVQAFPMIISQPSSLTCVAGATGTFSVFAGPDPLAYQWWRNGTPLTNAGTVSGAATPTLTLGDLTTNDTGGSYLVVVSNGASMVTSTVATLVVESPPPLDGVTPYAWWRLIDGIGSQALDSSGNGRDGTLDGVGVTWTNGHGGTGLNFDGSGATVDIAESFTLSGDWSAAMWVYRRDSGPSSALIAGSGSVLKLAQWDNTGEVGFTVPGVADYAFNYSAPLNTWTHLTFVKVSTNISLYADGALADANTSNTNTMSLNVASLGKASGQDYLDAMLDDVRIYNQALTAQQVSNLFANGTISPVTNPPPVFTNLNMSANKTSFTLTGTGAANQIYVLLTTSNLASATWTPVATNTADVNGIFSLTDLQTKNYRQRFYILQAQ